MLIDQERHRLRFIVCLPKAQAKKQKARAQYFALGANNKIIAVPPDFKAQAFFCTNIHMRYNVRNPSKPTQQKTPSVCPRKSIHLPPYAAITPPATLFETEWVDYYSFSSVYVKIILLFFNFVNSFREFIFSNIFCQAIGT